MSKLMNQKTNSRSRKFEAFPNQLLPNVDMFIVLMKLLWTIIDIRFLVHPWTNCIYTEKENTFLLGYYLIYYLFEEITKKIYSSHCII